MKLSAQSYTSIVDAIKKALERYLSENETSVVTDIYLQPLQDTGELVLYNDNDEELSRVIVQDWTDCVPENFHSSVESDLKQVLGNLQNEGLFDQINLLKPYSIVLVDEEKETIAELLLIDENETMFISDELLKGLDEELDAFLKELLEKEQYQELELTIIDSYCKLLITKKQNVNLTRVIACLLLVIHLTASCARSLISDAVK